MNEVKFKANKKDLDNVKTIPAPAVADDGKLLGVTLDESGETPVAQYELVDAPDPLPTIASGDAGKVLTVNAGETAAEWAAASGGGASISIDSVFVSPAINETVSGISIGVGEKTYTVEYVDMSDIPGLERYDTLSFLPSDVSLTFDEHVIAVLKAFTAFPDLMHPVSPPISYTEYAVDNQINVKFEPDGTVQTKINLVVTQGLNPPDNALISLPSITYKKPTNEFIACYKYVFSMNA